MDQSYEEIKNQRTQIAADSKDGDPIVIGIAWRAADSDLFIAGVKLAVKEINQKGGVLNSPLHIIINDTESAFNDAALSPGARQEVVLKIANSFAANPYLTAVIGHSSSSIAVPASVVYQNNGILFLAPSATNAKLTGHNFDYIFRTIPTTAETGT
ncbi:MAG: ABC transporter substrate-binding protein, partial [Methylococcaceae bacterium]